MKICIMCESTLLQKSLEYYLQEYLTSYTESEFIISDIALQIEKPVCLLDSTNNTHIKKPFTPVSLFKDLQSFYHTHIKKNTISHIIPSELDLQDPKIQTKIDHLLQEFSKQIYNTLQNDKK